MKKPVIVRLFALEVVTLVHTASWLTPFRVLEGTLNPLYQNKLPLQILSPIQWASSCPCHQRVSRKPMPLVLRTQWQYGQWGSKCERLVTAPMPQGHPATTGGGELAWGWNVDGKKQRRAWGHQEGKSGEQGVDIHSNYTINILSPLPGFNMAPWDHLDLHQNKSWCRVDPLGTMA